uniref:Galactokinase n=1 Tax=Strigamia maritima TaxID=126957 RepID=T1IN04_STRMM
MALKIPTIDELKKQAHELHFKTFGKQPEICVTAPGRVNLIGEHTDYNDGYVLPIAIPLVTLIVGNKVTGEECNLPSVHPKYPKCTLVTNAEHADEPKIAEIAVPTSFSPIAPIPSTPKWMNYVRGVLANFHHTICPFQASIVTSVPIGGGLSSSASLEVATYTFLEELTENRTQNLKNKALACQKAEHDFAHMPCGIMDQFASCLCKPGNALLLDCESSMTKHVPITDADVTILITNSNVRHELTGTEYPTRRRQCEDAAKLMGKKSLRKVSSKELQGFKETMDPVIFKRARHVVSEIERTIQAAQALENNDMTLFGKLMLESHISLRDDFEVSCKELDELVRETMKINGVFGTRMTGGGFGGCTVTMVKSSAVPTLIKHLQDNYSGTSAFFICEAVGGAQVQK